MPKKKTDEPSIGLLSNKKDELFIATGIDELDDLLGGGLPRARIVEMWGQEGVGKTHLASLITANLSKDHKVLYVDSEFALNKVRVVELGAEPKNIAYLADSRLERVCEALVEAVGKYDVIVLDSLAQLTPIAMANAEIGERSIGLFSLLLKHWILKFRPELANSKTTFLMLNQYRPPIGLYAVESPPGGMAVRHSCDIRIKLTRNSADKIMTAGELTGHWVHLEVKKNRLGKPGGTTKIKITY